MFVIVFRSIVISDVVTFLYYLPKSYKYMIFSSASGAIEIQVSISHRIITEINGCTPEVHNSDICYYKTTGVFK